MNYKNIIKARGKRLKLLKKLNFVPDKTMLKLQYRIKMGRRLNLKNPQRFTEKLQWYKLYYKNPVMVQCVDKYDVRDYVKSKGFEDILVPCYGVYDSADQVHWDELPEKFVMKDTLGGGGNSVIIVKDKNNADISELQRRGTRWTSKNIHEKSSGREWPYNNGKNHRIIIEQYLEGDNEKGDLIDYKFFCFDGKVEFLYVMGERVVGKSVKVSILDENFKVLPVQRVGDEIYEGFSKPANFDQMKHIAEELSKDFPHVRVDLYHVKGKVLFGELTFYNASGYMKYNPDSFDQKIGAKFNIRKFG